MFSYPLPLIAYRYTKSSRPRFFHVTVFASFFLPLMFVHFALFALFSTRHRVLLELERRKQRVERRKNTRRLKFSLNCLSTLPSLLSTLLINHFIQWIFNNARSTRFFKSRN